jgi:hypothetical protein
MQSPSQQEVIDSVQQGIRKAQRNYKKASESLLCWGPEYLITTNIFQSLLRLPRMDNCLCLEEQARELEKYCRNRRSGRKPRVVDGRTRCDLVLWHVSKDEPIAVIEVKRWAKDCSNDLKRLVRLVSQGLKFAVAASCLFEEVRNISKRDAESKLRELLSNLCRRMGQEISESGVGIRFAPKSPRVNMLSIQDEMGNRQKWVWCPVCFVIYHKKNQR